MKFSAILIFLMYFCLSCTSLHNKKFNILDGRTLHYDSLTIPADPLSLTYNENLYHIFYRNSDHHNKNSNGSISHMTSKNLIDWNVQAEISLNENRSTYFGGFTTDPSNISHLGNGSLAPIIAVLAIMQGKSNITGAQPLMIYSTDNGNSWKTSQEKLTYPKAFLDHPQDINIIWHEKSLKWIMSLFSDNRIEFYSSADLRSWNFESSYNPQFSTREIMLKKVCFFSQNDDIHWTLMADWKSDDPINVSGGTFYINGLFDGHSFTCLSSKLNWIDFGKNIYSSIALICPDERRLNLLWSNNPFRDGNTEVLFTIPTQMAYESISSEPVLSFSPLSELKLFSGKEIEVQPGSVSDDLKKMIVLSRNKTPIEITVRFNTREISRMNFPSRFGLIFWNDMGEKVMVGYETSFMSYFTDLSGTKSTSPDQVQRVAYNHSDSLMEIKVLFTPSYIKCFGEDNKIVITEIYSSAHPLDKISIFAENGIINLVKGTITQFDIK